MRTTFKEYMERGLTATVAAIAAMVFGTAAYCGDTAAYCGDTEVSHGHISIPVLGTEYPRMIDGDTCRQDIRDMLGTEAGAKAMDGLTARIRPYTDRHVTDPEWIVSRLQMYWDSHADKIYVRGEELDHVSGHAPVPTVRFTASRGTATSYRRPRLEDIKPYQDSLGLWMHNKTKPGEPLEWADPRKTGRNVESINLEIMNLARDAAFLWWWSGDSRYAQFAADIFDTYMTGLYYRDVPEDVNHGHQQTIIGLTSFEVIHEDTAIPAAECYDFLHDFLVRTRPGKISIYEDAFRKWADCIIAGGVPHNNWNLIQAQFVLRIALILGPDSTYSDGRGREWYLNEILNEDSIRQWSPGRLIEYGFDPETGLWKESPGYSMMVLNEWGSFIRLLDTILGVDLVSEYPILAEAARNIPQYLFPNGIICGWGDTHCGPLSTSFLPVMIENAALHGKDGEEEYFTRMYKYFVPEADINSGLEMSLPAKVSTFTSMRPPKIRQDVAAGTIEDYVSPVFWSEGVSWFAARTGMDPERSLMVSIAGSMGNHMHANGISMELYGRGYIMAPDAGRGSGYTSLDYTEYYSQFPAHNTVCVDGVSSYPVMQSRHAYRLDGCYPMPEKKDSLYKGLMFGDFRFLEPETYSDQRRQVMIVNTDPANGYYIDVFRSRRRDGKDKMHDYFYHNIGQEFTLSVKTEPTEELSFAGAHLSAYSYLWNKSAAMTDEDISGVFTMTCRDGRQAGMKMWMKGEKDRKVFKAYAPYIDGLSRMEMPYDVKSSPCQTFVARQYGNAWDKPFIAVYEPYSTEYPGMVETVEFRSCGDGSDAAGIIIGKADGRQDVVISSDSMQVSVCGELSCEAVIAMGSRTPGQDDDITAGDTGGCGLQVFMHKGRHASFCGISIECREPATAAVAVDNGRIYYMSDKECTVRAGGKKYRLPASGFREL